MLGSGCQVDAREHAAHRPACQFNGGTASGSKVVCCSSARRWRRGVAAARADRASTGPLRFCSSSALVAKLVILPGAIQSSTRLRLLSHRRAFCTSRLLLRVADHETRPS